MTDQGRHGGELARREELARYGEGRLAGEDVKRKLQEKAPPASKAVAVVMLFPVGGVLLALSGVTLTGTVVALAVTTPLFVLFSPVLVPAAIVIALAVTGFLASGAFGLTAITAFSWIVKYLRSGRGAGQEQLEQMKRRMAEAAGQVGQKAKDAGQRMEGKGQEAART